LTLSATLIPRTGDSDFNHQAALALFGEFALKCDSLDDNLTEGCRLVGEALGTHLAKVIELQPDGHAMLIRAGVGWQPGIVGRMLVDAVSRTPERSALDSGEPVISPDIDREDRFEVPAFVKENGVRALASVVIVGAEGRPPFGVLQVDSRGVREFSPAETQFLRNYANLLAAAVERLRVVSELRARAEDSQRLLLELQHRVKNNLQTVMNLVTMRVRRAKSPEAVSELHAIGDGIEALRLVHDNIYRNADSMDRTCLGTYLGELAASLLRFHGKEVAARVRLMADVEQLDVPPDIAIPLGLVTSEFMTNSLKYAFGDRGGAIGVRVRRSGPDLAHVALWDDGAGLPRRSSRGTGLRLIEGLVGQLKGEAAWETQGGTRLDITVPVPAGFGRSGARLRSLAERMADASACGSPVPRALPAR